MLLPFGGSDTEDTDASTPEVVPIQELSHEEIEAAEAEIEAEEDEWPTTA